MSALRRAIASVLQPLRNRVMLMIGRCVIEASSDEERAVLLQVRGLHGEVMSGVEQILTYGHTCLPMPPSGEGKAEGILVAIGGDRRHAVVIATEDRRYRPRGEMQPGENVFWDHQGSKIHLRAGNEMLIKVPDGAQDGTVRIEATEVEIVADTVTINGDLVVTGDVSDADGSMAAIRTGYNAHTHVENDAAPAPTEPPNPTI